MLLGMPVYQFKCVNDHQWMEVYSIHDETPATVCPECSEPGRKLFAPPPIIFNGAGFASTDG